MIQEGKKKNKTPPFSSQPGRNGVVLGLLQNIKIQIIQYRADLKLLFLEEFFFLRTTEGRKKKRTCFCLGPAVSDLCGSGPAVVDLQEKFEISSNLCIFRLSKIWTLGVQKVGFFVGFFGVQIWVAALRFFFCFERNL